MVLQRHQQITTIDDFIAYALQPENSARNFEFVDGEMIEKMPGSTENSTLAFYLGFIVQSHCEKYDIPCYISGEAGAYRIGQNVLAPDFAYKTTPATPEYPDPIAPLWVMEVISPNDKPAAIRKKRQRYLEAGILLWELYPDEHVIDVYAPGQPPITYNLGTSIPVGVIKDLTVEVAKLFR
jgi:Uma2 family endonuclease